MRWNVAGEAIVRMAASLCILLLFGKLQATFFVVFGTMRNEFRYIFCTSFDTLQSGKRKSRVLGTEPCLNTSYPAQIPWRPLQKSASPQSWGNTSHGVLGLDEADSSHNLTYSYSSSEDSLNESFSINFTPKKPRSAGVGLRTVASPLYATPTKAGVSIWQREKP